MSHRIKVEVHETEDNAKKSSDENKYEHRGFSVTITEYRDASWSNRTEDATENTGYNKDSTNVWVLIATK